MLLPWKAKVLQMHTLDEIELAVLGLHVDGVRVFAVKDVEHFEELGVGVVVAADEAVFLAAEPALL